MGKPWPPEIEAEIQNAYNLGQEQGLIQAGAHLVEGALQLFKLRKDDDAHMLRDLALEIGRKAEPYRKLVDAHNKKKERP